MPEHRSFYAARGKRWCDLILTVPALIVFSPVILVVALLVRVKLGAPVLFRQVRPGWHARPFTLYKFRTMRNAVDAHGRPLPDAERLTRFGKVLRSTSLDELPELWNIVRGDMGVVGPRPLLMQYLERYTPEQARRHNVRPGLTGYAQVHGRNAIEWKERLRLDVWYVEHYCFGLDLRILLATLGTLFTREGVSQPGHATMEEFQGDHTP